MKTQSSAKNGTHQKWLHEALISYSPLTSLPYQYNLISFSSNWLFWVIIQKKRTPYMVAQLRPHKIFLFSIIQVFKDMLANFNLWHTC